MNEAQKDLIISYINNDLVLAILEKYSIDIEEFAKKFAIQLIEIYYKNSQVNNLVFFIKSNKLEINDIFLLCNRFKKSVIEFEKTNKTLEEKEIELLYEKSFSELLLFFTNEQNKKINEQNSFIVEQSKFTSMGEMMAMIVHQWRQPLQTVSILVQKIPLTKMIEKELQDEFIEKVVHDVSIQLNYMSKTMDDFRDFFKPQKDKSFIKCSQLIVKAQEFLNHMFEVDDILFEVKVLNDVQLNVCSNDIVQVLINIIKNARDALIEKDIVDKRIVVTLDCNEKFAIIKIEDNALGISNEIVKKIFDQYFSTKKDKGTGLGLYICKKIIEESYLGKLSFENGNFGAIFKIELLLN